MTTPTERPTDSPWLAPPAPRGTRGGKAGGFAANGQKNTHLGDAVEAAIAGQIEGFESELDGKRQGPFDLRCGDLVFEVKACTVEALEYKMKPKKIEVERKRAAAQAIGATPASIIAVVDGDQALVYWRDGLGAFRLTTEADWHFAGVVTL
jgi:hypothetical protein